MILQADPKLTKADFDAEPWQQTLAAAKEPTCFDYCGLLKAKIENHNRAEQTRTAQVYTLLHATASLCPSGGASTKPFRPAVDFSPAFRSASLDDFGADEVSVLADVAPDINDPEFRARVADLAWVLGRNYKMARLAIPAYLESAVRLESASPVFIERLQRAIQLALMVGRSDPVLLASVTSEIEKIVQKRAPAETKWTCADLMRLLIQAEAGDKAKYSALCGSLATQAEGRQDWNVARTYWGCKAEWHRLAKEAEPYRDACIKAAETYVGEAESALKRPTPSHGACAGLLMRAVEALRKIPETKPLVERLHQRILKEQELIVANETTTHQVSADISDVVKATVAAFRSKPLEQALLGLAMIGAPPAAASLRSSAEESMRTNIWPQIVPSVYMTEKGKHLAEKPSSMEGNQESQDLCLKAEMMQEIKWHRGLLVSGRIKPALHIINTEHYVRLQDLEFLIRDNPFVPAGREPIFIRGLFAGLSGDFLIATHLLVPQVENSIRHLLYNYAGEQRTSKLKADLTQPERDLNELLYRDDVKQIIGEDLLLDLQSLMVEPGFGANLRNQLAHGLMDADQFYADEALYAWWTIWRICCLPELMRMQAEVAAMVHAQADAPDAAKDRPKKKIGILAFGSLINDPGEELLPKIIMRIKTPTPFPVEYGRYSGTRGGAPTLVPHAVGASVSAEILVLNDAVTVAEARDMLWRRERRKEGTGEAYVEGTSPNSVLVREWADSPCVIAVLYTDFRPDGKIEQPTADDLAKRAIQSVKTAKAGEDGISYLMNNIGAGVKTPLTTDYEAEILKQTKTHSLQEALAKAKTS